MPIQVAQHFASTGDGNKVVAVEIAGLHLELRPILHGLGHLTGKGCLHSSTTARTALDLSLMFRHFNLYRRHIKDLTTHRISNGHSRQIGRTMRTIADLVYLNPVWFFSLRQRLPFMAFLSAGLASF
jgi:hypothetical protein